jgi:diphthine-ammonia ligase
MSSGPPFVVSWSGGKDSCLALHRAIKSGMKPLALLSFFEADGSRSRSHGLRPELIRAQSESLSIPLMEAQAGWSDYESVYLEKLKALKGQGCEAVVLGDIELQAHRDWQERVCESVGLQAIFPLWKEERRNLVEAFLGLGFQTRLVAVQRHRLAPSMLGRTLDATLMTELEAMNVDVCGENGEFHTFVVAGPGFHESLELIAGDVREVEDHWRMDFTLA